MGKAKTKEFLFLLLGLFWSGMVVYWWLLETRCRMRNSMSPTRPRDLSTSCASNRDENPMLSFLLELTEIHSIRSVHHLTSCFTNRRTSLEGCFRRPFTCLPISVSCRVISRKISTLFGVIRRKKKRYLSAEKKPFFGWNAITLRALNVISMSARFCSRLTKESSDCSTKHDVIQVLGGIKEGVFVRRQQSDRPDRGRPKIVWCPGFCSALRRSNGHRSSDHPPLPPRRPPPSYSSTQATAGMPPPPPPSSPPSCCSPSPPPAAAPRSRRRTTRSSCSARRLPQRRAAARSHPSVRGAPAGAPPRPPRWRCRSRPKDPPRRSASTSLGPPPPSPQIDSLLPSRARNPWPQIRAGIRLLNPLIIAINIAPFHFKHHETNRCIR